MIQCIEAMPFFSYQMNSHDFLCVLSSAFPFWSKIPFSQDWTRLISMLIQLSLYLCFILLTSRICVFSDNRIDLKILSTNLSTDHLAQPIHTVSGIALDFAVVFPIIEEPAHSRMLQVGQSVLFHGSAGLFLLLLDSQYCGDLKHYAHGSLVFFLSLYFGYWLMDE